LLEKLQYAFSILNRYGPPGDSNENLNKRVYSAIGRIAIFNRFVAAKKLPIYWSEDQKRAKVAEILRLPDPGELTNEFVGKIDEQLKYLGELLDDTPSLPTGYTASERAARPEWVPSGVSWGLFLTLIFCIF